MTTNGWIGPKRAVEWYLLMVGADRDPETGEFILSGKVASFLDMADGDPDVVIDGDVEFYRNGEPGMLAAGLRSTSAGVAVRVIM